MHVDPRTNFLAVMEDLKRCVGGWDSYELLRVPGLLRLLLADASSLADQLNREHRLKLRFEVGHTLRLGHLTDQEAADTILSTVADSFDPEYLQRYGLEEPKIRTVTREELLQLPILAVGTSTVTVLELVRHLAYVHGLVHSGEPETRKDAELLELRRCVELGNLSLGLREIRAVGRVVLRGLEPLRAAVASDAA